MKKVIFLNIYKTVIASLGLAIALPLFAADSGQINYQARLLDSYGRRVNDTVDLSFKIYDAVTAGNLLWSETQAGVFVQDGVYSVVLGSQTAIPASVFSQNTVYLELGINGETMSPRQQITASAYSLVARTIMGSNVYENQTSGYVGVGTTNPAVKLDVSGTVQATGFKMPTGAIANYVLASDASGVGTWQPYSVVVTEHDPIHTNWVRTVYTPATNDIWNAVSARVLASIYNAATGDLWGAVGDLRSATNDMWDAADGINARVLRAGDTMTGPLTNNILFAGNFAGNGAGLTNVPSGGVILTGYVQRIGDTMTGVLTLDTNLTVAGNVGIGTLAPAERLYVDGSAIITTNLTVSNSVFITLTNQAGYFIATNSISLGGVTISNWNSVAGGDLTNDLASLQGATNALYGATNALNIRVNTDLAAATNDLYGATNALNIRVNTDLAAATNNLYGATNALNIRVNTDLAAATNNLYGATNALNTAVSTLNANTTRWDNAVLIREGIAGDAIAYSNLYYYNSSDSKWYKANATNSTTASGLLGLALGNAAADAPIPGSGLLLNGYCTNDWGFTAGSIIYMDTNAGALATSAPAGTNNIVRIVGYAISTNNIYFNPDRTYIQIVGQ